MGTIPITSHKLIGPITGPFQPIFQILQAHNIKLLNFTSYVYFDLPPTWSVYIDNTSYYFLNNKHPLFRVSDIDFTIYTIDNIDQVPFTLPIADFYHIEHGYLKIRPDTNEYHLLETLKAMEIKYHYYTWEECSKSEKDKTLVELLTLHSYIHDDTILKYKEFHRYLYLQNLSIDNLSQEDNWYDSIKWLRHPLDSYTKKYGITTTSIANFIRPAIHPLETYIEKHGYVTTMTDLHKLNADLENFQGSVASSNELMKYNIGETRNINHAVLYGIR